MIHNDANEHNVLVGDDGAVSGLIDFGDVVWSAARVRARGRRARTRCWASDDPVRAVVPVVAGYHEVAPLRPDELEVLFDLMPAAARDERRDGRRASTRRRRTTTTC